MDKPNAASRARMEQTTERLEAGDAGIGRAAVLLAEGRLVAFPTETVYGLGADARDDAAVARIFAAKGRPATNPLIVHLADAEAAARLAIWTDEAERVAAAFWPGPLTLVLRLRPGHGLSPKVTAGLGTVALRVPAAPVARKLLDRFGAPVAAPSANPSGRTSPTTADHVLSGLAGRIAAVVDGGACAVGLESTILDLAVPAPRVLRAGAVGSGALARALERDLENCQDTVEDHQPAAPGQMRSHYTPRARLRLNADTARPGEVLLGFGPVPGAAASLSETGDLAEAARTLFAALHRLDDSGAQTIAVSPIPDDDGLGRALNDRLRRAAAPREATEKNGPSG